MNYKKNLYLYKCVQPTVEITGLKVEFHLHTKKDFVSYKLKKLTHVKLLKIILWISIGMFNLDH